MIETLIGELILWGILVIAGKWLQLKSQAIEVKYAELYFKQTQENATV